MSQQDSSVTITHEIMSQQDWTALQVEAAAARLDKLEAVALQVQAAAARVVAAEQPPRKLPRFDFNIASSVNINKLNIEFVRTWTPATGAVSPEPPGVAAADGTASAAAGGGLPGGASGGGGPPQPDGGSPQAQAPRGGSVVEEMQTAVRRLKGMSDARQTCLEEMQTAARPQVPGGGGPGAGAPRHAGAASGGGVADGESLTRASRTPVPMSPSFSGADTNAMWTNTIA